MNTTTFKLSAFLPVALILSACNLPIEVVSPVAEPQEEAVENTVIGDAIAIDNQADITPTDAGHSPMTDGDLVVQNPDQPPEPVAPDEEVPVVAEPEVPAQEPNEEVVIAPEIIPENTLPVANGDALSIQEDHVLRGINVLANDSDADGDTLRIISFSQSAHGGFVEQSADGLLVYTPAKEFNGNDEFNYVISDGKGGEASAVASVRVASVNDITLKNENFFVKEDESLNNIDLLANELDSDGGAFKIVAYTQSVMGGKVQQNAEGIVTYTPKADFYGKDEFFYVVTDQQGGKEMGIATVWVESVNDLPVASPDSVVAQQSQSYEMLLLDNDKGFGDGVELVLVSHPENGTVAVAEDGVAYYQPSGDFFGNDSFIYKLVDSDGDESIATVSIEVECLNNCDRTFVLNWEPSESVGVTGYKVYVGNDSEDYSEILAIGDVTQYEYTTETKGTYFFAVSALGKNDLESTLTGEVIGVF